jgi:hypothetical protein
MRGDPLTPSLAQLYRDFAERWEIEPVPPGSKWIGVLRETDGGYITIVTGHDIGGLRYNMTRTEREEPEEREPGT